MTNTKTLAALLVASMSLFVAPVATADNDPAPCPDELGYDTAAGGTLPNSGDTTPSQTIGDPFTASPADFPSDESIHRWTVSVSASRSFEVKDVGSTDSDPDVLRVELYRIVPANPTLMTPASCVLVGAGVVGADSDWTLTLTADPVGSPTQVDFILYAFKVDSAFGQAPFAPDVGAYTLRGL